LAGSIMDTSMWCTPAARMAAFMDHGDWTRMHRPLKRATAHERRKTLGEKRLDSRMNRGSFFLDDVPVTYHVSCKTDGGADPGPLDPDRVLDSLWLAKKGILLYCVYTVLYVLRTEPKLHNADWRLTFYLKSFQ